MRHKAIPSVNPEIALEETHQRPTDANQHTEKHIANGVDNNVDIKLEKDESSLADNDTTLFTHGVDVEIKIEREHESILVDNKMLVKEEPVDRVSAETWHDYDSCIDVVKQEVCSNTGKSSEMSDNQRVTPAAYIEINMEEHYSCSVCNYHSKQRNDLKRHMRIHTGDKPFSCDSCQFKCADKNNLKRHIMTHIGYKPYLCNICQFKSSKSTDLKTHLRTHTGEKPYSCSLCSFKYTQRSSLRRHMLTHTGEKPFRAVCVSTNVH